MEPIFLTDANHFAQTAVQLFSYYNNKVANKREEEKICSAVGASHRAKAVTLAKMQ